MAQKKSERTLTGRAGGETIPSTMHRSLSCLISRETLLPWRGAPHTSSLQTVLKQRSLPQKKWPGREMLLSWAAPRSEEHTSELQSLAYLVCRLLLEKKNDHQ